jgi:hypothetical protein
MAGEFERMSPKIRLLGFLVFAALLFSIPTPACAQSATASADAQLDQAKSLARGGQIVEAEHAFRQGRRRFPHDARFPTEAAGLAFQQQRYARAAELLRVAHRLSPGDTYITDFLATVYFLEGNTAAALKYWNRIGKPHIDKILAEPEPRVSPPILDHAFALAPASVATLSQYDDTLVRIDSLGIFTRPQLDLRARDGGGFDMVLRSSERNGFGNSRAEALFNIFHAAPFQAIHGDYYNWHGRAINFTSMYRFDEDKRRIQGELSAPLDHRGHMRSVVSLDLRNENWDVRDGFQGPAPVLAAFNLRREAGGVLVRSDWSARMRWRLGAEVSARDMRNVQPGTVLTPQLMASGKQLKQIGEWRGIVLRAPERRVYVTGMAHEEIARLWSNPRLTFAQLRGELAGRWLPQAEGDDYAVEDHIRAGRTLGSAPFDELFMLGLERDNDLPMRAHIGTRDNRKGSAPLGRHYLSNTWEMDKNVYGNGLFSVKAGPFLDTGAISDANPALGSHKWLFDLGAQAKVRVFSIGIGVSYGKDLRSGNNAFYITLLR